MAIKVLHPELAARRDLVARFAREAAVVASLEHPHIVHVFDVGTYDGSPFLAMEYLDGETLAARLAREGRLPSVDAVDLLLGVVSAVAAAHARGVIHRDLKPDKHLPRADAAGPSVARLARLRHRGVLDAEIALTELAGAISTPPRCACPSRRPIARPHRRRPVVLAVIR
ncbi:MAG: protein kinase [Polyangiales bacterium]